MPKVSVIIPVYNVEQYLRQCLESVVNQTLKDIEIICVDDCSTDNSKNIIAEYCLKDSRVKGIYLEVTSSALVARKKGVERACGDYVLFLDADDYIELETCLDLYNKITATRVEILQFNSIIENCANIPEDRIKYNEKLLKPYLGKLEGKEIFDGCFSKKLFGITLWNKMFSTKLLRKSFSYIEDEYLPKAQDLYTFFVISYFARSYYGWNSKCYYHYCFGRGVTGSNVVTIETFKRYCLQSAVVDALKRFSVKVNLYDVTVNLIERFKNQWLNECILLWFDKIKECDRKDATKELFACWDYKEIVSLLAQKYWCDRDIIANKIFGMYESSNLGKDVKCVAIYYYHFTIGGVQRVISQMVKIYRNLGYRVVLVTDKKGIGNEFDIDNDIEWVTLQSYQVTEGSNYSKRIRDWENIIKVHNIDMVLYHAWTSSCLLWDLIVIECNQVPVVIQTHSVFTYSLISYSKTFFELPSIFRLASGVVTLSRVDKLYWSFFNKNVHFIPNPIDERLLIANKTNGKEKKILWVGRFSSEKQPLESIKIMREIVVACPEAVLYVIGGDDSNKIAEVYYKEIQKNGLEKNIKLLGFQKDVYQYLESACVNLLTSTYEGFPMVILEAKAHGVPTVMYSMPYIENTDEPSGVIRCNDANHAVVEIIALLQDRNRWQRFSDNAYENFQEMVAYDYNKAWNDVLLGKRQEICTSKEVNQVLIETIIAHYKMGWERNNRTLSEFKKRFGRTTVTDKVILFDLYRIAMLVFKCYKENGLWYTIKKCKEKLMG